MSTLRTSSGAAALAAAALLVSACSSGPDQDGHGPAGDPSQAVETPTEASSAPDDAPPTPGPADQLLFDAPVTHGQGVVVAAVPSGTAVWVTAPEPRSEQFGCEGVPFEFLQVLDPVTGDRQRAFPDLPDDDQPAVTSLRVSPDDPTRVLLVSGCEGFLSRIDVGTVQPDGTITDVVAVPQPEQVELAGRSIRWVGPDTLSATGIEEFDSPGLFVHDLASGEWMDLDPTPLLDWIPLSDGLAVEVLFDQARIVDEEGVVVDNLAVNEVVPFGRDFPLLTSDYGADGGDAGRTLLVEGVGDQRVVAEAAGFGMGFSPDGRFATWTVDDPATDGPNTTVLDLRTGDETKVPDVWFAGVAWLDGGIAFTSEGPEDAAGFPVPTVTFLPVAASDLA